MQITLVSPNGLTSVEVELEGVEKTQYEQISNVLGQGLQRASQAYVGVSQAMLTALNLCPTANPADLWVHVIYNQFRTRFGRSDQSWKRVGGQALEHLLISVYQPRLVEDEIIIRPSVPADAIALGLVERGLGSAKTDIILEGNVAKKLYRFGVIHSKSSIAERLTDDAPASQALIEQGYWSVVATMDGKMFPPPHGDGVVRGELGFTKGETSGGTLKSLVNSVAVIHSIGGHHPVQIERNQALGFKPYR